MINKEKIHYIAKKSIEIIKNLSEEEKDLLLQKANEYLKFKEQESKET